VLIASFEDDYGDTVVPRLIAEEADIHELCDRIEQERQEASAVKIADLAVSGDDVIEVTGVAAGPEVGRILGELLELVLEKPELNEKGILRHILEQKFR